MEQNIKLVKRSNIFKMIIPEEVESKIRYICSKVWDTEWSGVLFYDYSGSFAKKNLKIMCRDILVMDIGSSTYTEFNMSPEVIHYMAEHPSLLTCQTGLIHSHNNMSAFFSGTDQNTLTEEGRDRNNFVSLIVNNAGSYKAAVTRKVKNIERKFQYEMFGEGTIEEDTVCSGKEFIEWFDLDIEISGKKTSYDDISKRLEEIKVSKSVYGNSDTFYSPVMKGRWEGDEYIPLSMERKPSVSDSKDEQLTLFNNDGKKIDPIYDDIPYGKIHIGTEVAKTLVMQLITGSIFLEEDSKIDCKKWANSMKDIYEQRFGNGKDGIELFNSWAESYIDSLIGYIYDEDMEKQGFYSDDMVAVCAYDMIKELEKLPTNIYIEMFITILKRYLI